VIKLIPRREEFSVEDIKKRVSESGVAAAPKAVYNALSYLRSQGKVRRVGYGRYVIAGASFNTSVVFGEASANNDDESSG
jgi:Fe2+ or Zn2+ uptake regulation protein